MIISPKPTAEASPITAVVSDNGLTYNEPGITYNQAGVTYGGSDPTKQSVGPSSNTILNSIKPTGSI